MRLATWNMPPRFGDTPRRRALAALVDRWRPRVVALTEVADHDPEDVAPKGWRWVRPSKAQSAALLYDHAHLELVDSGARRVSSPGWDPPRFVVWGRFKVRQSDGPKIKTVASAHLVAFKTTRPSHGREYLKQQRRVARWLQEQPRSTVVLGDWNAQPGLIWTPDLLEVARASTPRLETGPRRQHIDYAWKRKDAKNRAAGLAVFRDAAASDHAAYVCDG